MNMVSIVILLYEVYLWVVFMDFYQPFLKKSIHTRVEYFLTVFCHYHYMIVAVIHAVALFTILYFFHNCNISRRFRIVYIYLLTQVVLRSNHKKAGILKCRRLILKNFYYCALISIISTRRFCALPSAVALEAIGLLAPAP